MFIQADDLRNASEDIQYLCFPFVQRKGTTFISAPPKSKKTFLTLQLATAIATGQEFCGWPTTRARTLYVEQEIGLAATKERYERQRIARAVDHVDMGFWTLDKDRLLLDEGTNGRIALHKLIKEFRPELVVFDPFRKMTKQDENSSTEMTKVLGELTKLQHTFEFAAVIVHHTGKTSETRDRTDPESMRGSSEIFGHGDCYGMMTAPAKADDNARDVHWTFRNHPPIDPFKLTLDDASGMFVRRADAPPKEKRARKPGEQLLKRKQDLSEGLRIVE